MTKKLYFVGVVSLRDTWGNTLSKLSFLLFEIYKFENLNVAVTYHIIKIIIVILQTFIILLDKYYKPFASLELSCYFFFFLTPCMCNVRK